MGGGRRFRRKSFAYVASLLRAQRLDDGINGMLLRVLALKKATVAAKYFISRVSSEPLERFVDHDKR